MPTETERFLNGRSVDDVLDARAIQPYFTGLVARECKMDISAAMDGEDFKLIAAAIN